MGLPVFEFSDDLKQRWKQPLLTIGCDIRESNIEPMESCQLFDIILNDDEVLIGIPASQRTDEFVSVEDIFSELGQVVAQTFIASGAKVSLRQLVRPKSGGILNSGQDIEAIVELLKQSAKWDKIQCIRHGIRIKIMCNNAYCEVVETMCLRPNNEVSKAIAFKKTRLWRKMLLQRRDSELRHAILEQCSERWAAEAISG